LRIPDDADFICAGTCIQMAKQGIEVTYMVLTNGDKGNHNPEITRNQLIAMRQIEQRNAAALSGVKEVLFMGEEDGFLRPHREIRKRVTQAIRRIRPELIICTNPDRYFVGEGYINHPDHRNAGLVAIEAIFPAADNPMFYPDMAGRGLSPAQDQVSLRAWSRRAHAQGRHHRRAPDQDRGDSLPQVAV
jgi:LmbE family N-acetylglucosaminyl deacetylase